MSASAVYAAAPHNDRMNIGSSWEGYALPNPPRGRGLGARASGPRPLRDGETRFPHPPRQGLMFTLAVHAAPPHNAAMNIRLFLGGLRPPKPSQGPGPGCAGLRPASAEVWGNLVSPHSWGLCSRQARFHCIVAYRLWGNQGTLTGTVMVAV